jgi:NAD-dependent deacetylase
VTIERAIELLATKESILVFTGAGISTESGIPDFRGPDGVWTRVDPSEFTIDRYMSNADTRRRSWSMRRESGVLDASPNDGHRAIADLWQTERMIGCVTQNIDGLHAAGGLPPGAIIELHGNAHTSSCVACGTTTRTSEVVARVIGGEADPRCGDCDGILKVDVVFFGEAMPSAEMTKAMAMAMACDAVVAVGSTLSVYPASYVPLTAVESGSPLVVINQGPTELDHVASAVIDAPSGVALRTIIDALID